jgi:hypothetical protein
MESAFFAVLYLTPRESRNEVEETALLRSSSERALLFRAQWQDIIELFATRGTSDTLGDPMVRESLDDVTAFLRRRALTSMSGHEGCFYGATGSPLESVSSRHDHFDGFRPCQIRRMSSQDGGFYGVACGTRLFARHPIKEFQIEMASWVN